MMKWLTTEKAWFAQLLVMVWANFFFLALLAVFFGGMLGPLNWLWWLFWIYAANFYLVVPSAIFGFVSALAWSKTERKDRASTLALLSGLAMGTFFLVAVMIGI